MIGDAIVTRSLVGNRVVGGTWTLATGATWTLPAVTLGGTVAVNGQVFDSVISGTISETDGPKFKFGADLRYGLAIPAAGEYHILLHSGASAASQGWKFSKWDGSTTYTAKLHINTVGQIINPQAAVPLDFVSQLTAANTGAAMRFYTYDNVDAAALRMSLTGGVATAVATWAAVTHTGLDITSGQTLKVAGTSVVGARVVDARCDDVVDATYGAEEAGVLDALRDCLITHGLLAAA